jgi:hypothetical protein
MNEIMSGTAQDFQQTAQNMRATAQQVVTDIAAVRAEVNSAILDLPDETRANADAMRKVVSDQIAALTALADVIKKQAGGLDISGPGLYAPSPKDETDAGSPSSNGSSGASPPLTVVPTNDSRDLSDAGAHPGNGAEKNNAEVAGDLSHETESLMQKLNGVARDLVEVTDGTVPADLEQRYLAGESHVYTHRLFEERGSRVRRMIRNRYHDDKTLRERVDSYVRLFERLLDRVSSTSHGKELADACLASESGKLYLLMANASGRTAPQ